MESPVRAVRESGNDAPKSAALILMQHHCRSYYCQGLDDVSLGASLLVPEVSTIDAERLLPCSWKTMLAQRLQGHVSCFSRWQLEPRSSGSFQAPVLSSAWEAQRGLPRGLLGQESAPSLVNLGLALEPRIGTMSYLARLRVRWFRLVAWWLRAGAPFAIFYQPGLKSQATNLRQQLRVA